MYIEMGMRDITWLTLNAHEMFLWEIIVELESHRKRGLLENEGWCAWKANEGLSQVIAFILL